MDRKPLSTWVHPKGRLVLLGDACHTMLVRMLPCRLGGIYWLTLSISQPYRAQGAAIIVEDAAVLGALLSHVSSLAQVPALLKAYQDLRYVTYPLSSLFSLSSLSSLITHAHKIPPRLTETPRLPRASTTQDSSAQPKDLPPARRPRARGTKRCPPRWRPNSATTTTRKGESPRFRRTGTRTSGRTGRRVGSSWIRRVRGG